MGEMCCSLTAATSVVAIILVVLVCQLPIANSEIVSSDTAAGTLGSVQNITLPEQINQMLDFFSPRKLAENWMVISDVLTRNCSNDMESYLQGLSEHAIWAMKMDDASGHYSSGFFYGNNYWTGSISLCTEIHKSADEFSGVEMMPFDTEFFVLKTNFNDTRVTKTPRVIFLGLCLPSTCSTDEVLQMARFSDHPHNSIQHIAVRSPTIKHYDLWADTTFILLFTTFTIVMSLCIAGTGYELYLKRREEQRMQTKFAIKDSVSDSSSGTGCTTTTYDLTKGVPGKANEITLDISRRTVSTNSNNSDENLTMTELSQSEDEEELSIWEELLLSFSVVTNLKAICDKSVGSDTISSIHGLRAFSMAWVILGHTCIIVFKYSDNTELRKVVEKEFIFQTVTNGPFSVDTFFVISGFLVSFIYFRTNAKGKLDRLSKNVNEVMAGANHFFGLIGYRFVRLTTPYMFVLGCVGVVMKYYEQYSIFEPPTLDHENCPKYWWRNILYINTLFPVNEMCMLWSWYLANDTQFYIIGAIILIIAVRHFRIAATILVSVVVSSWLTTGIIAYNNNHIPNTDDPFALFDMIYDKPWTRIGPYLVGMSVGWILFKTDCKVKLSKFKVCLGWTLSLTIGLYLIYGLYNTTLDKLGGATYSSLSHSAWAMSIAWIIFACSTGYGGWINKLLSSPIIYPFSRTTYCAYLVHPIVIRIMALNSTAPMHLGKDLMVIYFFGQTVSSYVLAFMVSVMFEAPVVTMLKILSPSRKKSA